MDRSRSNDELLLIGLLIVGFPIGIAWFGWFLAARFTSASKPSQPIEMVKELVTDSSVWPSQATFFALPLGFLAIALLIGCFMLLNRNNDNFNRQAKLLKYDHRRLKEYRKNSGPPLGRVGSHLVSADQEQTTTIIAGPRTGKTESVAVPACRTHLGPVLFTSNKRDLLDKCVDARTGHGKIWVCDPSDLAPDSSTEPWFWDPLTAASTFADALKLATIWERTLTEKASPRDPYFGTEGLDLLASLLLAANKGQRSLLDVLQWTADPYDTEPISLLENRPEFKGIADSIAAKAATPDKQRAGIYGTAASMIQWAKDPQLKKWITAQVSSTPFDPKRFASSTDSLALLSRGNDRSAIPFVTALTAFTLVSAEREAAANGGRLTLPLLAMLDEAANVCPWPELPEAYSHYGSRGILLCSIFQGRSQLVKGFGETGAKQILDSTNMLLYLGGSTDSQWLKSLADLCGEYDENKRSTSYRSGEQNRSSTYSTQRRPIFTVAHLQALPAWKGLLLGPAGPVPIQMLPYFKYQKFWDKKVPKPLEPKQERSKELV